MAACPGEPSLDPTCCHSALRAARPETSSSTLCPVLRDLDGGGFLRAKQQLTVTQTDQKATEGSKVTPARNSSKPFRTDFGAALCKSSPAPEKLPAWRGASSKEEVRIETGKEAPVAATCTVDHVFRRCLYRNSGCSRAINGIFLDFLECKRKQEPHLQSCCPCHLPQAGMALVPQPSGALQAPAGRISHRFHLPFKVSGGVWDPQGVWKVSSSLLHLVFSDMSPTRVYKHSSL